MFEASVTIRLLQLFVLEKEAGVGYNQLDWDGYKIILFFFFCQIVIKAIGYMKNQYFELG